MNELTFKSHTFTPVIVNNLPFLRVPQIEDALNYRSGKLLQIYNRHADEFTPEMSTILKLKAVDGKMRDVRVFSLRGCHLLAMFSKTPVAKEFRRWVLDLIEQHHQLFGISEQLAPVPVDMKAIGGMVKKCCAAAVRQELAGMLDKIVKSGDSYKSVYPTSDDDLIKCLWSWYATHHKKTFDAMQEITAENDQLKCKLLRIKQAVN